MGQTMPPATPPPRTSIMAEKRLVGKIPEVRVTQLLNYSRAAPHYIHTLMWAELVLHVLREHQVVYHYVNSVQNTGKLWP